jgi:hypothetical protein
MLADDVQDGAPGDDLSSLLSVVAGDGWGSAAGRQAILIMRSACRREAVRWTRKAGWLTDEGLATVWEQMDRLVRAGRFDDAPGLLRLAAGRAYAAEAAAVQTGMGVGVDARPDRGGPPRRRAAGRQVRRRPCGCLGCRGARGAGRSGGDADAGGGVGDGGWTWPVPPMDAVMASAAGAASTSRRCRSAMAAHETGVPATTWSALDLLTLGSGPGCRPEARSIGASMQFDAFGAAGVRGNRELVRVVRAAVEGRLVRTGRKRAA